MPIIGRLNSKASIDVLNRSVVEAIGGVRARVKSNSVRVITFRTSFQKGQVELSRVRGGTQILVTTMVRNWMLLFLFSMLLPPWVTPVLVLFASLRNRNGLHRRLVDAISQKLAQIGELRYVHSQVVTTKCPSCSGVMPLHAKFCGVCGKKLSLEEVQ